MASIQADVSAWSGISVEAEYLPLEVTREQIREDYTIMYEEFNQYGYDADIKALRYDQGIDLTSLEEYLCGQHRDQ